MHCTGSREQEEKLQVAENTCTDRGGEATGSREETGGEATGSRELT